jgi:hypothetical protein
MIVCGVKITHDGAVALIENNRLIFSMEMEKINNNIRHEHINDFQVIFDILALYGYDPVGAGNGVTLCDLGVFVDQAAEPVPAQNARTGRFGRRMRTSGGRLLLQ